MAPVIEVSVDRIQRLAEYRENKQHHEECTLLAMELFCKLQGTTDPEAHPLQECLRKWIQQVLLGRSYIRLHD